MTPELRTLSERERFDWLRLSRSGSVGPRTFLGLLQKFGTATAALDALPHLAKRSGRAVEIVPADEVERELDAARKAGIAFVALCEAAYPSALRAIDSAPPILAVQGRLDILEHAAVAIVGSRNASGAGLLMTERLARGIGQAGHPIVSGLARGIDAAAHKASLASGTVAVLAGGHERIYPSEHIGLARKIAETGAVISEMPIAWEPRARDFPRRNRIVSGLSLATVVVEAARRSGSLITARFANEQGREVFAVPGSPLDPRAEGTNDLLRQGATLCTSAEDVVDALAPLAGQSQADRTRLDGVRPQAKAQGTLWEELDFDPLFDDEPLDVPEDFTTRLDALIGEAPMTVDDLARLSAVPVGRVQTALVELELDGVVQRQGNGSVVRRTRG